ncbi:MAG: CapA family protein [Chloroflexi bacterium]|nr:CapA family protein [Chloroflexota bacterium]
MVREGKNTITLVAVGDVSPNRDNPPSIFHYCGNLFRDADIAFGQMEAPLSDRGTPAFVSAVPRRLASKNISALTEEGAGFDVMSHACNHAMDYGWEAFNDTLEALKKNNIAVVGAGENIHEARRPAVLERDGTKVGFLAYLSIVYPGLVAQKNLPGCAPLRATNCYQQIHNSPGTPPLIVTKLYPEDRATMEEDIRKLRPEVDVLVVSIHAGVVSIPAMIAMYQKEAAYAAIDAGADLVLEHHAHILKGIEVYKGKVVFYSLGNWALEHTIPIPGGLKGSFDTHSAEFRRLIAKLKPEPGYEKHTFGHDALKTTAAKAYIQDGKIQKVTYIPAYITPNLEPEVLTRQDPRAQEVFDYVQQISASEDLNVRFSWEGDEVLIG